MENRPFFISLLIMASTIALATAISARGVPAVVKTNLEKLPTHILEYAATEDYFSDAVYKELNADKHIYRHYRSADGKKVDLYIGYYGTSKGGRTPHNPYACFSGAGWAIVDSGAIELEAARNSNVNYLLTGKSGLYQVVLHWYQKKEKIYAGGWKMNLARFEGLIFRNRNDGAFVRVSVTTDKAHVKEAEKIATAFASRLITMLPGYWPEEK